MTNKTTLLPCPFCGGEAVLHPTYDMDTGNIDGWFAWCDNDTCECKPETGQFFTETKAIAAWNTRATHGTLTAEQVREAAKSNSRQYESPVDDGVWIREYDWQAIADELNARAERTCRIESSYLNDFTSEHECWYEFEMQCGYRFAWGEMEPPKCCPSCGAKVVFG